MRVVVRAKLTFCEQFDAARLWRVASSQTHNRPSRQLDSRGGCVTSESDGYLNRLAARSAVL
jgi:hypothetical protein